MLRHLRRELTVEPLELRLVLEGGPVITEFMAANDAAFADGDGNFSDWIEIYNPADRPVSLQGWYLSDKDDNPTKWRFPEVTLAPNGDPGGGDYLVVFASGQDDAEYPYYDAGGYLHTNFNLDRDGENVLLVDRDGVTIAHAYVDYPPQYADVSYGFYVGTTWNTLVDVGAPLRYHVPTPGDAALVPTPGDPGWTAPGFADSAWTDSAVYGAAGIVISEVNTGETNFVEIQNVSGQPIGTTGWLVLLSDPASGNINAVNPTAWALPEVISAGEVLYRTDQPGDNYLGDDVTWEAAGPGWAMVIDHAGAVTDFLAWGYDRAQIESLEVSYGPWTNVTAGGQWDGDGALPGIEPPGAKAGVISYVGGTYTEDFDSIGPGGTATPTGWIAGKYGSTQNRQPPGSTPDSETLTVDDGSATQKSRSYNYGTTGHGDRAIGHLPTTSTGDRALQLALTNNTGAEITEFTLGYTGEQWREWEGAAPEPEKLSVWYSTASGTAFTNLGAEFDFEAPQDNGIGMGGRPLDGNDPANRTVIGGTFVPPAPIANGQTCYITWHDFNDNGTSDHALAVDDVSFTAVYGPRHALQRTGQFDTDSAADFARTGDPSKGTQNAEMTVPFGVVLPTVTGIGFSHNQPAFEDFIETNVAQEMQDVNASLWSRIEFAAGDLSDFSTLTLKMRYDDGFAAYLNGQEVARRNAPQMLAFDSTATDARPDQLAVVFEDVDVTQHLGLLQPGANLLAVHGLNVSADDVDLLIQPKLVAAADVSPPRFFANATPGGPNDDALGAPLDSVVFSRPGGTFTGASISVGLSSESPDAAIHYTLDGTVPTEFSLLYSTPLTINTTTELRARAYQSARAPSPIAGQAYIKLAADVQGFTSDLPIVVLENFGGRTPGGSYMVDFNMTIFEPQNSDGRSALTNVPEVTTRMGLKKRGASSAGWPKSHYRLETRDQYDEDLALPLLGMPEESDWVLGGPWTDKALIRNSLVYDLGGDVGVMGPRTRHVEVFRNQNGGSLQHGDYMGVYILVESVKRDPNRVDVPILQPSDVAEPDITGGYIIRFENEISDPAARLSGWEHLELHRYDLYTPQQRAWINNYVNEFDSVLFSGSFRDPVNGYAKYIDLESFVAIIVINELTRDQDSYVRSDYLWKDRGGKLTWGPLWDYNLTMDTGCCFNNRSTVGWQFDQWYNSSQHGWINRLFDDPDFSQLFIDRWHEVRQNEYELTNLFARIDAHADPLREAQERNFQKWDILGDDHVGFPTPATNTWQEQIDVIKNWLGRRINWIDARFRAPPQLSRSSGQVTPGAGLSIGAPAGIVYYTTDGSDPRASGGGIGPTATRYTGSITLGDNMKVIARAYDSSVNPGGTDLTHTQWSAPSEAVFVVDTPAAAGNLAISEINYHPHDATPQEPGFAGEDFEFIELMNTGVETIALGGVQFVDGIEFEFDAGETLAPDGRLVVVNNASAFQARYGAHPNVAGQYGTDDDGRRLSNTGEGVALEDILSATILDFGYNDGGGWPGRADGKGATLELIDIGGDYDDPDNWRSSTEYGGSPGSAGAGEVVDVVINEVLSHTDPPLVDAVELYNATGGPIDVGGWYLSDSWGWDTSQENGDYKKYQIPAGTTIAAGGYRTFYETDFNPSGGVDPKDFALSGAHGDDVWLMEADGSGKLVRFVDHVEFDAAAAAESFGRWPDEHGDLWPMTEPTLDAVNSGPRVGPLVISEVQYYPGMFHEDFNGGGAERFTEIRGNWNVASGRYDAVPAVAGGDAVAVVDLADPLPADYLLRAEAIVAAPVGGYAGNAALIFDYHGPADFKFAGLSVDDGQWRIGHRNASGWTVDAAISDAIEAEENYELQLRIDGSTATLYVEGGDTVEHDFAETLNDGSLGLGTDSGVGSFGTMAVEPPREADLEFIEIYNPTAEAIQLAGRVDHPQLPTQYLADWRLRKGVDMEFDRGTTIGPRSTLVVLSFDPNKAENASRAAAFRSFYGIDATVPLTGGFRGRLSNGGERVQLQRPDSPPAEEPYFVPHYIEDQVDYDDTAPWPARADGNGASLHRTTANAWAGDAANWAADSPSPGSVPFVVTAVVDRHVFYNDSIFDGGDPAANADDDHAMAPDKQALLPGGTATTANYTSYTRGVNGVMVDVEGLANAAELGVDDFRFRAGNDDAPHAWDTATPPAGITVRPGEGTGGSDRITIIWDTGAVAKQWLQVTVLDTVDTGLSQPDVFYFGNAMGESCNSTVDAKVGAVDMLGARDNQRNFLNPAPIDFHYDFNRDARVNTIDMLIARDNQTHFLNALKLITVPPAAKDAVPGTKMGSEGTSGLAAGRESRGSLDELNWLYELAIRHTEQRTSQRSNLATEAVEELPWSVLFGVVRTGVRWLES